MFEKILFKNCPKISKEKMWSVKVYEEDDMTIIEHTLGFVEEKVKHFDSQNIVSNKNETTPYQQAIIKVKAQIRQKIKTGYFEKEIVNDILSVTPNKTESCDCKNTHVLAKKYDGKQYIAIAGHSFFSNEVKQLCPLKHIFFDTQLIFDKKHFNKTMSRQSLIQIIADTTGLDQQKLKLIVYDIPLNKPFEERQKLLEKFFAPNDCRNNKQIEIAEKQFEQLKIAEKQIVQNQIEIVEKQFEQLKIAENPIEIVAPKQYDEGKFKIVGFKEGVGREKGCVIWKCLAQNGKVFCCRPQGSLAIRKQKFFEGIAYIGQILAIRYHGLTKEGTPRLPLGILICN